MSNLKKALYVLLYDQYDIPDMDIKSDEETYIEYIIDILIQKNDNICPFKNYSCGEICNKSTEKCNRGLYIDCNREKEDVWKEFIKID
ncbi:hypothetical protein [Clostridium algidicarnis]|uniref:hypothetical protein n=1 Tax=Clostridium algidicarnis TaxID=37659 RepID=UPI00209B4A3A|nr:hypothetical protein [Clostridium algidicarnis]